MSTTVHVLKTSPAFFEAVWSGEKTFEVRYDDRGYQRGHQVRLREFDQAALCETCPREPGEKWHTGEECAKYSGREVHAEIGHVLASTPAASKTRPGFNGLGYVVFSLINVGNFDRTAASFDRAVLTDWVKTNPPLVSPAEAARRVAAASGGERS